MIPIFTNNSEWSGLSAIAGGGGGVPVNAIFVDSDNQAQEGYLFVDSDDDIQDGYIIVESN